MKINKQNKYRFSLVISVVLLSVIAVIAIVCHILFFEKKDNIGTSSTEIVQHDSTNESLNSSKNSKEKSATSQSKDVDTTKTTDEIPTSNSINISISSLSQNNGAVSYEAAISGVSSGTCSATFTSKIGKPVVKTSQIRDQICKDVINETMFDILGEWNLELSVYSVDTRATVNKTIVIQ